jgi:hypothetical protein
MSIRGLTIPDGDLDEGRVQTEGAALKIESARHAAKIDLSHKLPAVSIRSRFIGFAPESWL